MIPKISLVDFISFYIELPVMLIMFLTWLYLQSPSSSSESSLSNSKSTVLRNDADASQPLLAQESVINTDLKPHRKHWYSDLVDVDNVDLSRDEYADEEDDILDDEERTKRVSGRLGVLWTVYYWVL